MNGSIVVLEYKDDGSDKIWAIDNKLTANGEIEVWYGRRDNLLRRKCVSVSQNIDERISEKISKGYRYCEPELTIENNQLVSRIGDTENGSVIPTSLWYRVCSLAPLSVIRDYLNTTTHLLSGQYEDEIERLTQLHIYKSLYKGELSGGTELSEGPLAILLLFGLRRYLNDMSNSPVSGDLVQIVDDSNNMLPERFEGVGDYIEECCEDFFVSNGWMSKGQVLLDGTKRLLVVAKVNGFEHYTSVTTINKLAIAMGCIDAPIDLNEIETDKKAAFF